MNKESQIIWANLSLAIVCYLLGMWVMHIIYKPKINDLKVRTEAAIKESKAKNIEAEQAIKSVAESYRILMWEMHEAGWQLGRLRGMMNIMTHNYDESPEAAYREDSMVTASTIRK